MSWVIALFRQIWHSGAPLERGGWIMIPIAAVSLWMWLLIFRKVLELIAGKHEQNKMEKILACLRQNATSLPNDVDSRLFSEFRDIRTHDRHLDAMLMDMVVSRYVRALEKHLPTIVVLASIAPLLGLLGTVNGMISAFHAISRFGTENPRALAAGISEALITTQSGLAVAVPGLLAGVMLQRYASRIQMALRRISMSFVDACSRNTEQAKEQL